MKSMGEIKRAGIEKLRLDIENYLLDYIRSNKLKAGAKLPSSNELAERFETNRSVVRGVLSKLSQQGRIYTEQGRGCFVSQSVSVFTFEHQNDLGFSEILRGTGEEYTSRLVKCSLIRPTHMLASLFSLGEEEKIYHIELLRCLKGQPLALCNSYIPYKLANQLDVHLEVSESINDILQTIYGYTHPRCENVTVSAVTAKPRDIQLLGIGEYMPILQMTNEFSVPDVGIIEYYLVRARGDCFRFSMKF